MIRRSTDPFAALIAYRAAPLEERVAMIQEHYARLRAERIARYERRHGPGSAALHQAEARARPLPGRSDAPGYYGVGGHLSGSEYAAGGYRIGGRARR